MLACFLNSNRRKASVLHVESLTFIAVAEDMIATIRRLTANKQQLKGMCSLTSLLFPLLRSQNLGRLLSLFGMFCHLNRQSLHSKKVPNLHSNVWIKTEVWHLHNLDCWKQAMVMKCVVTCITCVYLCSAALVIWTANLGICTVTTSELTLCVLREIITLFPSSKIHFGINCWSAHVSWLGPFSHNAVFYSS